MDNNQKLPARHYSVRELYYMPAVEIRALFSEVCEINLAMSKQEMVDIISDWQWQVLITMSEESQAIPSTEGSQTIGDIVKKIKLRLTMQCKTITARCRNYFIKAASLLSNVWNKDD